MSKTELVYTTYIKTTPEKLWNAITNPEFAKQYWGGMVNVSEDWKVGSTWEHQDSRDGNSTKIEGKVLESNPFEKLVLSWSGAGSEDEPSQVVYEIVAVEEGMVRFDVVHSNLEAGSGMHGGVSMGWPLVIANMKTFLENGGAVDIMAILKGGCGKS